MTFLLEVFVWRLTAAVRVKYVIVREKRHQKLPCRHQGTEDAVNAAGLDGEGCYQCVPELQQLFSTPNCKMYCWQLE